jgi:omega-amidase
MDSSLTITIIQASLHWEDKAANLRMFGEKIRALNERTELVILPEMFSTGFSMNPYLLAEDMEGETIQWMRGLAGEKKIILTGSFIARETNAGGESEYFNRLVWMLPDGQMGYYDKRHLFGYAAEDQHYKPGNKRLIASVKGWRIHLLICYDLRFPVWSRQQLHGSGPEYDLLVYVANWPDRRRHAWRTLLQARAIENQCFVAGVNRVGTDGNGFYHTGDSMVVNPMGDVLMEKKDEEFVHTLTLQKSELESVRQKLPFWKDGDGFLILNDSGNRE